jgi:DNA-3-methyladenine glycosylase
VSPKAAGADRPVVLPRSFFDAPAVEVAPRLLGQVVENHSPQGIVRIRLTEVEAYLGPADPASHAFRGRTPRNAVMFGPPGYAYVYFTYGMHFCLNLVCGPDDVPSAVLLRAGEVVGGLELATTRRLGAAARELARGPARLTVALGVDRAEDGADVCSVSGSLRVVRGASVPPDQQLSGPRVGVSAAAEVPWRFWIGGDTTVSAFRRYLPRRRPA